jgi:hypothetical protein
MFLLLFMIEKYYIILQTLVNYSMQTVGRILEALRTLGVRVKELMEWRDSTNSRLAQMEQRIKDLESKSAIIGTPEWPQIGDSLQVGPIIPNIPLPQTFSSNFKCNVCQVDFSNNAAGYACARSDCPRTPKSTIHAKTKS